MTFALRVTPIVGENTPITFNVVDGINDKGTMALCRAEYASNPVSGPVQVFGRGIRDNGSSCIFEGLLEGKSLFIKKSIISPGMPLTTERGEDIVGLEDPTAFRSPSGRSRNGLLCTRAFRDASGGISADTIWLDPDAPYPALTVETYLDLDHVRKALAVYGYTEINLAKEVNRISPERTLFEIGGRLNDEPKKKSRIIARKQFGSYEPFLEPTEGDVVQQPRLHGIKRYVPEQRAELDGFQRRAARRVRRQDV